MGSKEGEKGEGEGDRDEHGGEDADLARGEILGPKSARDKNIQLKHRVREGPRG
jgi:hypothetical protein